MDIHNLIIDIHNSVIDIRHYFDTARNVCHYCDVIMCRGSVSNHQPHDCLLNRLFRRRSKKLAFVRGLHWGPMNSQHKWPVTRQMFPFDDVIMLNSSDVPLKWCHVSSTVCLRPLECLSNIFVRTNINKVPNNLPFVKAIHRCSVDSPHKRPSNMESVSI